MVAGSAKAGNRKAFAASLAAVFNALCCDGGEEGFCASRQLLCQILLTTVNPASAAASAAGDECDPAWEWLERILLKCCSSGLVARLYRLLQPRAPGEDVW